MAYRERDLGGETTIVASPRLLWCDLLREVAVLNPDSGRYFLLQEVGAAIWRLVQEPRSVTEIESILSDSYDVEPTECREHLRELMESLVREGLVALRSERDERDER